MSLQPNAIGGFSVLRYGGGQAGILRTWGKIILSSAATFGYTHFRSPAWKLTCADSSWYEGESLFEGLCVEYWDGDSDGGNT